MKITKKYLTERCREILHSYRNGERVSDSDLEWLINNVFKYHDEWETKSKNLSYIYIDKAAHGTTCFNVRYLDGSHDDISFVHSIKCKK